MASADGDVAGDDCDDFEVGAGDWGNVRQSVGSLGTTGFSHYKNVKKGLASGITNL